MSFTFSQRIDLEKAANDCGFENVTYSDDGSVARLAGTDTPARLTVRSEGGGWTVIFDDQALTGVIADEGQFPLGNDRAFPVADPAALGALLLRAWRLSRALPNAPLRRFEAVMNTPDNAAFKTEVERMVRQRRGQDIFRQSLMDYWDGRCAVTGIDQPELLRASHMKPWTDCANDAERLDVFNGLLLTADWDAAFDKGLVTFDDDGRSQFASALRGGARERLGTGRIRADRPLTPAHRPYLAWHRTALFDQGGGS
jgi:putative restriction endonuclease